LRDCGCRHDSHRGGYDLVDKVCAMRVTFTASGSPEGEGEGETTWRARSEFSDRRRAGNVA
jgi:hypothetical protein